MRRLIELDGAFGIVFVDACRRIIVVPDLDNDVHLSSPLSGFGFSPGFGLSGFGFCLVPGGHGKGVLIFIACLHRISK